MNGNRENYKCGIQRSVIGSVNIMYMEKVLNVESLEALREEANNWVMGQGKGISVWRLDG